MPRPTRSTEAPSPPRAPRIKRSLSQNRSRIVAIVPLVAIIVAAMTGVLGEGKKVIAAEQDGISLRIEYPTTLRFSTHGRIAVTVINNTDALLPDVNVVFDRQYFSRFTELQFVPAEDVPLQVPLGSMQARQAKVVAVDVKADKRGAVDGWIAVSVNDAEHLRASIRTIILP